MFRHSPNQCIASVSSALVLLVTAAMPTSLHAQDAVPAGQPSAPLPAPSGGGIDLAFTIHASTLGYGAEISKLVGGHLAVRVGANTFNYNRAQTITGVDYNAKLAFKNFTGLVDLFPMDHGSFHLTGGMVSSTNAIDATGVPGATGTINLNGTTYTSAQVGVLSGKLAFPSSSPYVGIGWGSPSRRGGRVRLITDMGAVIGSPTLTLHASNEGSNAQLAADVTAQRTKTQTDVNKYAKVWPVFSMGLSVHF